MEFYVVLIVAIAMERVAELGVSRRNLAWARARSGRGHGFGPAPSNAMLVEQPDQPSVLATQPGEFVVGRHPDHIPASLKRRSSAGRVA